MSKFPKHRDWSPELDQEPIYTECDGCGELIKDDLLIPCAICSGEYCPDCMLANVCIDCDNDLYEN